MKSRTRKLVGFICSILIFTVGITRVLTESLSSTPLFVAYLFMITGLVGTVSNGLMLRK